jgi:hypothetical protein
MTYEQLRKQLRLKHSRKRATVLVAAAVVGVASAISAGTAGVFSRHGVQSSEAKLRPAADSERAAEPLACRDSAPAEVQSPRQTVLALVSLRPTLP